MNLNITELIFIAENLKNLRNSDNDVVKDEKVASACDVLIEGIEAEIGDKHA